MDYIILALTGLILLFFISLWGLVYWSVKTKYHPVFIIMLIIFIGTLNVVGVQSFFHNFTSDAYSEKIPSYEVFVGDNKTIVYYDNKYDLIVGHFTKESFNDIKEAKLGYLMKTGHWTWTGDKTYEYMRFVFVGRSESQKVLYWKDVPVEDIKVLQ